MFLISKTFEKKTYFQFITSKIRRIYPVQETITNKSSILLHQRSRIFENFEGVFKIDLAFI